jgi:hypothetical protein
VNFLLRLNDLTNQLTLKERELLELKHAHSRLQKGGGYQSFSSVLWIRNNIESGSDFSYGFESGSSFGPYINFSTF